MNIALLDTEIDPTTHKVMEIGCILDERQFHGSSLSGFADFLKGAQFVCGHNVLKHDLKYIHASIFCWLSFHPNSTRHPTAAPGSTPKHRSQATPSWSKEHKIGGLGSVFSKKRRQQANFAEDTLFTHDKVGGGAQNCFKGLLNIPESLTPSF